MSICEKVRMPGCGTQEKCTLCECTKIDARVCLPCNHQFCHSCVNKNLPPDCPTMTSCPKCNCDVDRQRRRLSPDCYPRQDPCASKPPEHSNDFFCYNCIKERGSECRVQAKKFCLDCDVPLCDSHLKQHKTFIKKKQHTMLPISQYMLTKKKFEQRRCKIHPKHTLMFVCTKCDVIVCQVCVACCDCERGGRHDARELDVVAMEMATKINQSIKDVDCVRVSGEQAISSAQKEQKKLDCELERLKQEVKCLFQEKMAEIQRYKEEACCQINEISQSNLRLTLEHREEINVMLKEAVKVAKEAKKLLCYSHNIDIATEAHNTQTALNCLKSMKFPCLNLTAARIGSKCLETSLPCISYDNTSKTFCPQPCIPDRPAEDQCDRCTRPSTQCPPASSVCNPTISPIRSDACVDPCERYRALRSNSPNRSSSPNRSNSPHRFNIAECPSSDGSEPHLWANAYGDDADDCITPTTAWDECDMSLPTKGRALWTGVSDEDCSNDYYPANESCESEMDPCDESQGRMIKMAFSVVDAKNLTISSSLPKCIDGLQWTLKATAERNEQTCDIYLGLFLVCQNMEGNSRRFECRVEDLRFYLIDQLNPAKSMCKRIKCHVFSNQQRTWGLKCYCDWDTVMCKTRNFLFKNSLRVKAEMRVHPVTWC